MAVVTMKQLLEAGVHFGHQTRRWNPKMRRFIFGERNGIYIVDLHQTLDRIDTAYRFVRDTVADGGTVLFVGTKKQAQEPVERAGRSARGMPYINFRWLGGMLTNFQTVHARVAKLRELQRVVDSGEIDQMPKKEGLKVRRDLAKLERNLGGIKNLEKLPARGLRDRHEEGAHRGHRGEPPEDPGRRGRRHELRPRHHRLRHPRQRRRDPCRAADEPRDRRRGHRGQAHRAAAQRPPGHARRRRAGSAAAPPARPQRTAGGRARRTRSSRRRPRDAAAGEAAGDRGARRVRPRPRRRRPAPTRRAPARRGDRPTEAPAADAATAGRRAPAGEPRPNATRKTRHMADISAKDVAALRKVTGAGMMDCKKRARRDRRRHGRGQGLAARRRASPARRSATGATRTRARSRCVVEGNVGALVELNCETDFVAKGDVFKQARRPGSRELVLEQGDDDLGDEVLRRRDRRRLREGPVRHARREDRARPRRPVRDGRRSARRLQARAERARRRRRARRARRRRPGRRQGHARSRTTSRCTSPARRRVTSPRRRARPTSSTGSATVLEAQTARRGQARAGAGRRSSTGKLNGFFKTVALLEQPFVKDQKTTIEALVDGLGGDAHRAPLRPRQDRRGVAPTDISTAIAEKESLMPASRYRRVVLKLSGEAFADQRIGFGIDAEVVLRIAEEVTEARARPRRRDRDRRRRRQHLPRA